MSFLRLYREVRDLVKEAEDAPLGMIPVDLVARMLEVVAESKERGGRLTEAQTLRQFSADLQEWAGSRQRRTELSLKFVSREEIFLP